MTFKEGLSSVFMITLSDQEKPPGNRAVIVRQHPGSQNPTFLHGERGFSPDELSLSHLLGLKSRKLTCVKTSGKLFLPDQFLNQEQEGQL